MNTHKTQIRLFGVAAIASLLVPMASAQVTGAVNATTNAAINATNSATAAQNAAAASTTAAQNAASVSAQQASNAANAASAAANNAAAQSAVQASQAANQASQSSLNSGANLNTSLQGAGSAMGNSGAVNAGVNGAAGVQVDRNGASVNGSANNGVTGYGQMQNGSVASTTSGGISATLNSADTVTAINGSTRETRDNVMTQVNARLEASSKALDDLRRSGRQLQGEAKTRFDAAYDNVRARERDVRNSLNETRRASASTYSAAQAKLASDYQRYSDAVAQAEASASASGSAAGSTNISR